MTEQTRLKLKRLLDKTKSQIETLISELDKEDNNPEEGEGCR